MDNILDNINETCSICGGRLSAFGSKKLKDGVLCRECAKLVSEWYTDNDIAKKDVEAMKGHLAYRAENQKKFAGFKPVVAVDGKYKLYLDETTKQFAIGKKGDLQQANTDIFKIDEVSSVAISKAAYKNSNAIDVFVEIKLRNPQIKKVRFRVNEFPGIERNSAEENKAMVLANQYLIALNKHIELNTMVMKRR